MYVIKEEKEEEKKWCRSMSDANTHVNVLSQQLVRGLVLLDRVVVDPAGGEGAAEEEAEEPAASTRSQLLYSQEKNPWPPIQPPNPPPALSLSPTQTEERGKEGEKKRTYPPLKAPIGRRAGSGGAIPPAATASNLTGEVVSVRARPAGAAVLDSAAAAARAPRARVIVEAMTCCVVSVVRGLMFLR